jgi:hypothetical protein
MPMFSQPVVVFDHFGNIGKQPYRQELATSHNVMQELQERQSDVAALNLSPWMMAHSEAAQSRAAALNIRTDETAKKPCIRVADARRRMEAVYQQVTDRIDAVVNLRGKDALGGFYDEYNAHATEYKNTLAQHLGRVHGKNQNNNTFSNTENA